MSDLERKQYDPDELRTKNSAMTSLMKSIKHLKNSASTASEFEKELQGKYDKAIEGLVELANDLDLYRGKIELPF